MAGTVCSALFPLVGFSRRPASQLYARFFGLDCSLYLERLPQRIVRDLSSRGYQPLPTGATRGDYYLTVSRLEPHKHLDILLDAFSRLGYPLMIIGEGSQHKLLERKLPPNVRLLGWVTDDELSQYLGSARAFVHAAAEDFGIAMVEAQAAGCPVIAYEQGGAVETVIDGQTGRLYPEQSAECLAEAVEEYESRSTAGKHLFLDAQGIRQNALRFSKARFQEEIASFVNSALQPEWEAGRLIRISLLVVQKRHQNGELDNCRDDRRELVKVKKQ